MVMVVVFEFGVMRCQPLRRALCFSVEKGHISENSGNLLY
ncbi:acetyltransferase [Vibrio cholerae]|nr:acetyltransferase [Vibrio cholerae]ELE5868263.1 acetyltransferase [Vibrio cholerae]ELG7084208.1 acetyltransferase [Vibrio cholerae]